MKYHRDCHACGNRVTAYTHAMNKGIAVAFGKLADYYERTKKPCTISKDIQLTHNQIANFQKLQYFALVKNVGESQWVPTELGLIWYYGEMPIQTPVATMNNAVLCDDHEAWDTHKTRRRLVYYSDVSGEYKKRVEYQSEKSSQTELW